MTRAEAYEDVVRFHIHSCPGASFGLRVAEAAVDQLGRHGPGNELVAVTETDSCAVDAIQVVTGCTFGKRNLVHQDNGKNAFTFWRRGSSGGIRISAVPGSLAFRTDELWELADRVEAGTATEEETAEFTRQQAERGQRLLDAPADEILTIEQVDVEAPGRKGVRPSEPCEECQEETSVALLHNHKGRMLCPPCHLSAHGGTLPANHADHGHHHRH